MEGVPLDMDYTIRLIIALLVLRFGDVYSFNGHNTPRKIPSISSPLRVASTAWATSNNSLGIGEYLYDVIIWIE